MQDKEYLMESDEEALRLDMKTDTKVVERHAIWAGIKEGMCVADIGCGSGKTTSILYNLVRPNGVIVGVDCSEKRIEYARKYYGIKGIEFKCKNILESTDDLGLFDFVWVRFLLEYYRSNSFSVAKNISGIVKPGGILCLLDLDCNSLNHFGLPPRLERTLFALMKYVEERNNFDPYVGRKLYSFLYDLGYEDINVKVAAHHLIFGELKDSGIFNWIKKIETLSKNINFHFTEYEGGYEDFLGEVKGFFIANPRRFTYTPIILCRGRKPVT